MRFALFFLLLISQAVSAAWDDAEKPFNATKNEFKSVKITWIYAEDVQKACKDEFKKMGLEKITYTVDACSIWQGNTCLIITKRNPTIGDVGHEVRHCFQGAWH